MNAIEQVWARVAAQKTLLPAIYGGIDFDRDPERFTHDPKAAVVQERAPNGVAVTDEDLERVRAYTMLGDVVTDAYAMLMPKYGFRTLIELLQIACDRGIEHVADAPPELAALIHAMEQTPAWVDMDLVREGAGLSATPPRTWRPTPCAAPSSPPSSTNIPRCQWRSRARSAMKALRAA
ncbi:MAG: hypothetical protein M0D54_08595 [Hyphomonadaceae bacterium JAD_PAG50586_4]|nr:MAG: hypothetical protein M0D54_08595 [Hyphomonadaceae bacterium JAD_PAG50586_4]